MATCQGCQGNDYATFKHNRTTGKTELLWLCQACRPNPTMLARKPRGLAFYRKLTYQILLPVMAAVFAMVELGIHV